MPWCGCALLLAACCRCGAAAARPTRPPTAPDPVRVRLLDEVPNYAQILQGPVEQRAFRRDTLRARSGALRPAWPQGAGHAPITLKESIALALENNTGLRIQKLNPIAATARVRRAYAQFDPEVFGNVRRHAMTS